MEQQKPPKITLTTDYILSHIQPRLLSSEHHADRLSSLIKKHLSADIWLTWCVDMTNHPNMPPVTDYIACIPITYEIANQLQVTTEDLTNLGEAYSASSYSVMPMANMLKELCTSADGSVCERQSDDTPTMFVITNHQTHFGAAAILDKSIQHYLQTVFPTGFWLLPSSTHEFLAVTGDADDVQSLARMVADINRTVVAPEDVLSDHVFTLDPKGQLSVVI